MQIIKLKLGELRTNSYLIIKDNKALLIDPGFDDNISIKQIKDTLGDNELLAILYTHNHFDHIGGGHKFDCPQFMHEYDIDTVIKQKIMSKTMHDYEINVPIELIQYNMKKDFLEIGIFKFKVIHTPGHTNGGVCLLFDNHLFTGDTLFEGTWGRTDVGGNDKQIKESLLLLANLDENLTIHPGHGRDSTIGKEKGWILEQFG